MKGTTDNIKKLSLLKPRYVVIISAVLVAVVILSSVYEYYENKREIYHVLYDYANSMIQTVSMSSANSIISDREMENLMAQHLLGTAKNTARLDSLNLLSHESLEKLARENEVYRINVLNNSGERVMSNYIADSSHSVRKGKYSTTDYLAPIFDGSKKEIVIGLKEARLEKGMRFAVAVKRAYDKGAIVVNLDAESYLDFKNRIGFGKLILDIGSATGVEYIVLQSPKEILAANKNVDELSRYENDSRLKEVYEKDKPLNRIVKFGGHDVYEAVDLFNIENEKIGLFRIGLGMEEVNSAETRMLTRGIIVSLIVIVITVIVLSVIISNQNYDIISNEFKRIKTFTGSVLENMSLAIITVDVVNRIKIFNKSAFEIFGVPYKDLENKNLDEINTFPESVKKLLRHKATLKNMEMEFELPAGKRILLINSAEVKNESGNPDTYTLVIEDVTELNAIEHQLSQNEKLVSMGGLASGVAHEIRNPLNTINMIAQRMEREYAAKIGSEDFNSLIEILHSESKRVNGIIEQFLSFTKPPKLNPAKIKVTEFLEEIKKISGIQTNAKHITLTVTATGDSFINLDYQQMKQAFLNLIRNSIDAINAGGDIKILYKKDKGKNVFEISDTGEGIPQENLNKIFDIYFTTKKSGTGMGLSIVRQIIIQHGGTIETESRINEGTKFKITLP
ncbi:MAG: ATP-binding protein [Ignavibacteria bacterium]|nr:ATP-binding protein [Ignavibacteria bacterium]